MTNDTAQPLRQHVDSLVSALGDDVGIEGLSLTTDDRCGLSFDGMDVELAFDSESKTLFLSTLLEDLETPLDRDAMVRLMDLNGVLFNHHSSCITYDRIALEILQFCRLSATSLSKERFLGWVMRNIGAIEATRGAVRDALTPPIEDAEDLDGPGFLMP
jgi:hypothetical protein